MGYPAEFFQMKYRNREKWLCCLACVLNYVQHQERFGSNRVRQPGRRRHGALSGQPLDVRNVKFRTQVSMGITTA
jgi:hypothetical protein